VLFGVSGATYGQSAYIAGSVSFPLAGIASTDDTGPNQTGNAVNYTSMVIQSYAGTGGGAVQPNGSIIGDGDPYIIGTLGYVIPTSAHGSAASTTAFYYSPSTGLNLFGQFSTSSSLNYQDSTGTTSYNGITNQPLYFHTAALAGENTSGQIAGYQSVEAPDSSSTLLLGRHGYLYNVSSNTYAGLGLTSITPGATGASYGLNFNYSNNTGLNGGVSSGTYRFTTTVSIDNAGDASGTSSRYFSYGGITSNVSTSSASLGTSCFFYSLGTGNVETGLYNSSGGVGYSYQKTFSDLPGYVGSGGTGTYAVNSDKGANGGYEIGTVTPYIDNGNGSGTSLGTDGWVFNSHLATPATTAIGMYQSGQTLGISGFPSLTPSYSYAVTSSVNSVSSVSRSTAISALNASGLVGGTSKYYNGSSSALGTVAWTYNTTTTSYQQVGLTSNGFASGGTSSFVNLSAAMSSGISFINNRGDVVGTSTEYLSSQPGGTGSTGTTTVAWYVPAGQTAAIPVPGPSDPYHTVTSATLGSYLSDSISFINNTGLIGGTSTRYTPGTTTSLGTDSWIYDEASGHYYILDPYYQSTTPFSSTISYISDTGVVTGSYTLNNGPSKAFYWNEADANFIDLTTDTPQTDVNTNSFSQAYSYNPSNNSVFALGQYLLSNNTAFTPGGGVEFITVPEPASLAIAGASMLVVGLGRRRRPRQV
jgi:hypothetical protein